MGRTHHHHRELTPALPPPRPGPAPRYPGDPPPGLGRPCPPAVPRARRATPPPRARPAAAWFTHDSGSPGPGQSSPATSHHPQARAAFPPAPLRRQARRQPERHTERHAKRTTSQALSHPPPETSRPPTDQRGHVMATPRTAAHGRTRTRPPPLARPGDHAGRPVPAHVEVRTHTPSSPRRPQNCFIGPVLDQSGSVPEGPTRPPPARTHPPPIPVSAGVQAGTQTRWPRVPRPVCRDHVFLNNRPAI